MEKAFQSYVANGYYQKNSSYLIVHFNALLGIAPIRVLSDYNCLRDDIETIITYGIYHSQKDKPVTYYPALSISHIELEPRGI